MRAFLTEDYRFKLKIKYRKMIVMDQPFNFKQKN